jgi:hypothetical protein
MSVKFAHVRDFARNLCNLHWEKPKETDLVAVNVFKMGGLSVRPLYRALE